MDRDYRHRYLIKTQNTRFSAITAQCRSLWCTMNYVQTHWYFYLHFLLDNYAMFCQESWYSNTVTTVDTEKNHRLNCFYSTSPLYNNRHVGLLLWKWRYLEVAQRARMRGTPIPKIFNTLKRKEWKVILKKKRVCPAPPPFFLKAFNPDYTYRSIDPGLRITTQ